VPLVLFFALSARAHFGQAYGQQPAQVARPPSEI
jgi:hypothetical protein